MDADTIHVGAENGKHPDIKDVEATKVDSFEVGVSRVPKVDQGYHRSLSSRQIMMMAFGGGIGTGLWVGTGTALARAGPAGTAISYTIMVYIIYTMYTSIGEMAAYKPIAGGFIRNTLEYTDEALAFAQGLGFWYNWVIVIAAETTAALSVLSFWPNDVPIAAWITIMVVLMIVVNLFGVEWYGEVEFWMSLLKIIAIVGIIIFLFVMTSGGFPATNGPIEFRYWSQGHAFKNGIKGISQAFIQAGFSIGGGEIIAVCAGEAANPRQAVKKSVRPLFWRMGSFFVVNIWLVGMCVSPDDPRLLSNKGTMKSPFVLAILDAGYPWLAHLLNAFILLTVVSCGITSVYIASRSLAACSELGLVHKFFGKKDSRGRPMPALVITLLLGCGLSYLNCSETGTVVYGWFSSLVGIQGFLMESIVFTSLICFRRGLKAQGIDHKTLPYRDRLAPYNQYFCLLLMVLVMTAEFYLALYPFSGDGPSAKNFFASYLTLPLYIVAYFGYKFWHKTKWIQPSAIDFSAARFWDEEDRRIAEEKANNPQLRKRPVYKTVIAGLVGEGK
ncbi:hypothetical protein LTR10_019916 [Elasticomyces elasticus]|uniref:Amino acid permease/ SLC12A domain-containing protein n=1 Tax=Exophiala sideris TaxID=1016849 RepID=A0ABR0J9I5_9EURO|nr:hypothetical protein LTR10_019916 [Elasticomyces elasticus]KAK5022753.1 hypothetical protein LTS07_009730 [Exophiala sideris]KAK5026655.1 hypothetical protein LTR13_009878 [Exophiala sideris]KAK5059380.1 hypothetical protein LTR69_005968 [Exophiala sideris]KAK5177475.1 hypothetical protein LTR44_010092 [Eurotiomycetes sp. CCFEE 6388]